MRSVVHALLLSAALAGSAAAQERVGPAVPAPAAATEPRALPAGFRLDPDARALLRGAKAQAAAARQAPEVRRAPSRPPKAAAREG